MKYLVYCTCGHAMDRHGPEGCSGEPPMDGCRCPNSETAALDAAIDHARRHPWDGHPGFAVSDLSEGDAA
jgi:hypothetical protein